MQYIFDLTVQDGWPPVEAESLHFDKVENGYRLKSIPFFIKKIAYDDVLQLEFIDGTRARIKTVILKSGNSTIWIYFREEVNEKQMLSDFEKLNIGVEGSSLKGYFSLNLPKENSIRVFDEAIRVLEEKKLIDVAYGEFRH